MGAPPRPPSPLFLNSHPPLPPHCPPPPPHLTDFRALIWEVHKLPKDLFSRSPRELRAAEHAPCFGLSEPRRIVSNAHKLSYFVSHSWEDKALDKLGALDAHFKRRAGRPISLWLDKVCINQANPDMAITVLPILIGGCQRVLLLLSRSYLQRLWCVWELFSLFTFCNKELALERLELLPLEGGIQLQRFNIDHAHCFSPNEEFRLRQLLHDMDIARLKACVDLVSTHLAERALGSHGAASAPGLDSGQRADLPPVL